jgi:hypothetical protein
LDANGAFDSAIEMNKKRGFLGTDVPIETRKIMDSGMRTSLQVDPNED